MESSKTIVFEILSNKMRQNILLILYKTEMKWKDIKTELENLEKKEINPNAITFHLRKLMEAGLVSRYEREGMGVYSLTEQGKSVVERHLR